MPSDFRDAAENIVSLCLLSAYLPGWGRGDTESRCASSLFLRNTGPTGNTESSHASSLGECHLLVEKNVVSKYIQMPETLPRT